MSNFNIEVQVWTSNYILLLYMDATTNTYHSPDAVLTVNENAAQKRWKYLC